MSTLPFMTWKPTLLSWRSLVSSDLVIFPPTHYTNPYYSCISPLWYLNQEFESGIYHESHVGSMQKEFEKKGQCEINVKICVPHIYTRDLHVHALVLKFLCSIPVKLVMVLGSIVFFLPVMTHLLRNYASGHTSLAKCYLPIHHQGRMATQQHANWHIIFTWPTQMQATSCP